MPHFEELYPGRFLRAIDIKAQMLIRIVSMVGEKLETEKGEQAKGIITYKTKENPKGEMVCCKTNAHLIAAMFGDDYLGWAGKLIVIHNDPSVEFGTKKVGGIRVWGSPDLTAPKSVEIKRPRRKRLDVYTLRPWGKKADVEQDRAASSE